MNELAAAVQVESMDIDSNGPPTPLSSVRAARGGALCGGDTLGAGGEHRAAATTKRRRLRRHLRS